MQISHDRLEEFRRVYKEDTSENIALAEAREMAQRLLTLYQILSRPLPGNDQVPGGT